MLTSIVAMRGAYRRTRTVTALRDRQHPVLRMRAGPGSARWGADNAENSRDVPAQAAWYTGKWPAVRFRLSATNRIGWPLSLAWIQLLDSATFPVAEKYSVRSDPLPSAIA